MRRPGKPFALLTALVTIIGFSVVAVAAGVVTAKPAAALENGLARTPPMGFNNWNFTHCDADFNEQTIRGMADAFVSLGLRDVGYQYVNIDDCWAEPNRDNNGNLVPHRTRFPSGIKALADYVHARGLKFGIYTSAGTKTCNAAGGFPGALGFERQDAALFASWGVDYLKYDNCNNQGVDAQQRYTAMRDALAATGRPIVYSICEWGRTGPPRVWEWGAPVGNLWRTTGDISDNWSSMISRVHTNDDLAQYAGPGHWNDPDMLEVGNGGMTDTEYRTHFSLWAMMSAPLLIGSDIRGASPAMLNILRNTDLIAVDQDPLGRQATIVSSSGGLVVYSKPLANGDFAVALLNETASTATVSTSAAAIGLPGGSSYTLRDLWSKQTRTTSGAISASVPAHGTVVYRVTRNGGTPPPSGTGQLSDLPTLSATNGWGPIERDRSNGSQAAGDGGVITIGGVPSAKGLGVHAHSSVSYHLGGRCSSIVVDVGVDDEVGDRGRVVFQLWRDGVKVADSGAVTGSQGSRRLSASLGGATTLLLAVTDGGDGINSDHADWANPALTCSASGPVSVEAEYPGNTFGGSAAATSCAGCSGGAKVRFIGNGTANTLTVNGVQSPAAGARELTIHYTVDGTRSFFVSVNGGTAVDVACTGSSWSTPASRTITVNLTAGTNTVRFLNTTTWAPDLDRIVVT